MPHAKVGGDDLYYESHGDGPPLLLLHGAGGNHLSWWQQVPIFRPDYRVILIDHRGFGRSTDPAGEGSLRFVDDLESLLDQLGIEQVRLVCQSMGGITGLGFAVRHPQRVLALVLCDTWGFFDWPQAAEKQSELRRVSRQGGSGFQPTAVDFAERDPERAFLYQQVMALNPPDARERLFRGRRANAFGPEEVSRLQMPVLCIVGSEDTLVPPPLMRDLAELLPRAEYREFDGCGHSVYWENAREFNAVVRAFLDKDRAWSGPSIDHPVASTGLRARRGCR